MRALTPRRPAWWPRNSTSRSSPTTSPTCAPPATSASAPTFQDLLYEHISRVGAQTSTQGNILPVGIDLGSGVKTVGTPRLMTQGTLAPTGNDARRRDPRRGLLQDPDAGRHLLLYPRRLVPDGRARPHRHRQGNLVQPAITIPQNATGLTINAQGQVSVILPGSTTTTDPRPDPAHRFINKAGLQPIGDNLFTETPASGAPQDGMAGTDGAGDLLQGNLEQSNVNVGHRNHQPDRRAARLRDELQGDHRRRPDAVRRPPTCSR